MANAKLNTLLTRIVTQKSLSESEFLNLRKMVFEDGYVSVDEADLMFQVNDTVTDRPASWNEFFVGALTDFLVRQTLPTGYIDTANAAWLIERIDHDGVLTLETEYELLMNVLHVAQSVPERLEMYALRQVKAAVLEARGVLADGRHVSAGVVEERDVQNLRKILYATGGNGGFGISAAEAELLFDIDEKTQAGDHHESWQDLFVGAIANHLMTMGAPVTASFDEAKRRQEWLMSSKGLSWSLMDSFKAWREQVLEGPAKSHFLDKEGVTEAERIDPNEAAWVIERLNRDGILSENEKALLAFLDRECPDIHASLKPLIHAAA